MEPKADVLLFRWRIPQQKLKPSASTFHLYSYFEKEGRLKTRRPVSGHPKHFETCGNFKKFEENFLFESLPTANMKERRSSLDYLSRDSVYPRGLMKFVEKTLCCSQNFTFIDPIYLFHQEQQRWRTPSYDPLLFVNAGAVLLMSETYDDP